MLQLVETPLVSIEVTPDIAEALAFMVRSGVFDIKSGNATLSFDPQGTLKSIKKELFTYNK